MMRSAKAGIISSLATLVLAGAAFGQPKPVEGTEQVPNEHGSTFPKEIVWEKDGSVMVLIPHGTFKMGLNADNGGAPNEGPEREVTLRSFYIDKYEISNAQYTAFLRDGGTAQRPRPAGNEKLLEEDRPVCAIPWTAAAAYANWADKALPTEAMWEKAARGPSNSVYVTGSTPPTAQQVVAERGPKGLTAPVKEATGDVSGYGIFNMSGNVSEWVADWFGREYYAQAPSDNPPGPGDGETRVIRGGSYFSRLNALRATARDANPPTLTRDDIGFRTIWIPTPPSNEVAATPSPSPVPPPTREEVINGLTQLLIPYFEADTPKLEAELLASKAYMSKGFEDTQFINYTPFPMHLTFIGPDEELVYKYKEPLPAMTYRNVSLPRERNLVVLAYAPTAPSKGPVNLGALRAESRAIIVLKSDLFSGTMDKDKVRHPVREGAADQYYSDYTPIWNESEVFNELSDPILLRAFDTTMGEDRFELVLETVIEPKDVFQVTLKPGSYEFRADYIGATEESSTPATLDINDRAARRLLTIKQDAPDRGSVNVITERKPKLLFGIMEARHVSFKKDAGK